jgi:alpha-ketoglutarate-dependent taurine dioxygenase
VIKLQTCDERPLPTMIVPAGEGSSLEHFVAWTGENRESVTSELRRHGALLFRGFGFAELEEFESFSRALCPALQSSYAGGNSPRHRVAGAVFTSTEYPKAERISLHNEASYLKEMPRVIMFFCQRPASTGGQTPVADCRKILAGVRDDVRRRFIEKKVRYVNNLHGGDGVGRSWQQAFESEDRAVVEQRLREGGYDYRWKPDGSLQTSMVCAAVARHPETGEESWINQAEQWHPSGLPPRTRRALQSLMSEEDFPHNATFGDGSPLSEPELEHIREVMRAEEKVFEWQAGDVLVCDNLLVAHGRLPYEGERRVLVSLA